MRSERNERSGLRATDVPRPVRAAVPPAGVGTATTTSGQFRLLWAGQSVSLFGDAVALLAVPLLVLEMTRSTVAMALVVAARTCAYLAVGLVVGAVVDRHDARRLMIAADVVRAACFLAMPVLNAFGLLEVSYVLLLVLVAAFFGVLFETAHAVFVKDLLSPDELLRGNSRIEMSNQIGVLVGPAACGVVAATVGISWALVLNGASFVVSAAVLLGLRVDAGMRRRVAADARRVRSDILDGLRYMRRERSVLTLACVLAGVNFLLASENLLVYHMRDYLSLSAREVGLVVAAAGLGGIVGSSAAGWIGARLRYRESIIPLGILVLGGGLVVFALSRQVLVLALTNALFAAAAVATNVTISTTRQSIVPREFLGRVTSSTRVIAFASNPVGAVAAGALAQAAGNDARPGFLAAGFAAVVISCFFLRWARSLNAAVLATVDDSSPRRRVDERRAPAVAALGQR